MLALAVIPGIILFIVVLKFDRADKEPAGLLISLFLFGALTVVPAILIRVFGTRALGSFIPGTSSMGRIIITSLILTALVQEGGKFLVLKLITWKNREFNYTFDAVVYSVVVALGFSICMNVAYAFRFGVYDSATRLIFSVPGHAMNAVFMGYFYGLAGYAKGSGDEAAARKHLFEALLIPVVMHGFYDLCISARRRAFYILFAIYVILITVITIRQFISLSKNDRPIPQTENTTEQKGLDRGEIDEG